MSDTIDILSNGLENDVSWLEITRNSARPSPNPLILTRSADFEVVIALFSKFLQASVKVSLAVRVTPRTIVISYD